MAIEWRRCGWRPVLAATLLLLACCVRRTAARHAWSHREFAMTSLATDAMLTRVDPGMLSRVAFCAGLAIKKEPRSEDHGGTRLHIGDVMLQEEDPLREAGVDPEAFVPLIRDGRLQSEVSVLVSRRVMHKHYGLLGTSLSTFYTWPSGERVTASSTLPSDMQVDLRKIWRDNEPRYIYRTVPVFGFPDDRFLVAMPYQLGMRNSRGIVVTSYGSHGYVAGQDFGSIVDNFVAPHACFNSMATMMDDANQVKRRVKDSKNEKKNIRRTRKRNTRKYVKLRADVAEEEKHPALHSVRHRAYVAERYKTELPRTTDSRMVIGRWYYLGELGVDKNAIMDATEQTDLISSVPDSGPADKTGDKEATNVSNFQARPSSIVDAGTVGRDSTNAAKTKTKDLFADSIDSSSVLSVVAIQLPMDAATLSPTALPSPVHIYTEACFEQTIVLRILNRQVERSNDNISKSAGLVAHSIELTTGFHVATAKAPRPIILLSTKMKIRANFWFAGKDRERFVEIDAVAGTPAAPGLQLMSTRCTNSHFCTFKLLFSWIPPKSSSLRFNAGQFFVSSGSMQAVSTERVHWSDDPYDTPISVPLCTVQPAIKFEIKGERQTVRVDLAMDPDEAAERPRNRNSVCQRPFRRRRRVLRASLHKAKIGWLPFKFWERHIPFVERDFGILSALIPASLLNYDQWLHYTMKVATVALLPDSWNPGWSVAFSLYVYTGEKEQLESQPFQFQHDENRNQMHYDSFGGC